MRKVILRRTPILKGGWPDIRSIRLPLQPQHSSSLLFFSLPSGSSSYGVKKKNDVYPNSKKKCKTKKAENDMQKCAKIIKSKSNRRQTKSSWSKIVIDNKSAFKRDHLKEAVDNERNKLINQLYLFGLSKCEKIETSVEWHAIGRKVFDF